MEQGTITHEITEYIITLSVSKNGWNKELNRVSWNGRVPVYDIRSWSPNHERSGKGLTFTEEEMAILADTLSCIYPPDKTKSKGENTNG